MISSMGKTQGLKPRNNKSRHGRKHVAVIRDAQVVEAGESEV